MVEGVAAGFWSWEKRGWVKREWAKMAKESGKIRVKVRL